MAPTKKKKPAPKEKSSPWKSRKLWFSVFAIGTMYHAAIKATTETSFRTIYETFTGGVVAIAGLFLAGNITSKWVANLAPGAKSRRPPPVPDEAEETPEETLEETAEETPLD